MISTTTFTSEKVLNKILDDSLPKLTCMIAIPTWFLLLNMILVFWYDVHIWMYNQMPFPFAVLSMATLICADWLIVEGIQKESIKYKVI